MANSRKIPTMTFTRLGSGKFVEVFVRLVVVLVNAFTEFDFSLTCSVSLLFVFLGELLAEPSSLYFSTCQNIHPNIHIQV
ncbi:hypothetical protein EUGRSUZ_G01268 [Eucalyptus grandis]|uniref:Uncharacterized protein n=2 Tax=Eucalyptus grandis TaxID=71139 RepID=A0ACC3K4Q3_EUCGR|nr:hypothetical protein EUGRSUZ_G01268 [Eucalyptus grandis]